MEKSRISRVILPVFGLTALIGLSGCGENYSAPESASANSAQNEAIENWMAKRTKRRESAMSSPREVASPIVKAAPIIVSPPSEKVAVTFATPPVSQVERKTELSKQTVAVPEAVLPGITPGKFEAERGDVFAQIELGNSAWADSNFAEAMNWFLKAAEQGSSEAQLNVGMMYTYGQGVPQNHVEALKWLELALDRGDLNRQQLLGLKELVMIMEAEARRAAEAEEALIAARSFAPPIISNAPATAIQHRLPVSRYQTPPIQGTSELNRSMAGAMMMQRSMAGVMMQTKSALARKSGKREWLQQAK